MGFDNCGFRLLVGRLTRVCCTSPSSGAVGLPSSWPRWSPPRPQEAAGLTGLQVPAAPPSTRVRGRGLGGALRSLRASLAAVPSRFPLYFAAASVTLIGSFDLWGLVLHLGQGCDPGGDPGTEGPRWPAWCGSRTGKLEGPDLSRLLHRPSGRLLGPNPTVSVT